MNRVVREDTSDLIFKKIYKCRVPVHTTRSEGDLRTFGTVYTGNEHIDRHAIEQKVLVMWPIYKMAKNFSEGFDVAVPSESDALEIYQNIQKHLLAWKERLSFGLNIGGAPLDDLIVLDKFASSMFQQVRYLLPPDSVDSQFLLGLGGLVKSNPFAALRDKKQKNALTDEETVTINETKDNFPVRESLEDTFKDIRVGTSLWK